MVSILFEPVDDFFDFFLVQVLVKVPFDVENGSGSAEPHVGHSVFTRFEQDGKEFGPDV